MCAVRTHGPLAYAQPLPHTPNQPISNRQRQVLSAFCSDFHTALHFPHRITPKNYNAPPISPPHPGHPTPTTPPQTSAPGHRPRQSRKTPEIHTALHFPHRITPKNYNAPPISPPHPRPPHPRPPPQTTHPTTTSPPTTPVKRHPAPSPQAFSSAGPQSGPTVSQHSFTRKPWTPLPRGQPPDATGTRKGEQDT